MKYFLAKPQFFAAARFEEKRIHFFCLYLVVPLQSEVVTWQAEWERCHLGVINKL